MTAPVVEVRALVQRYGDVRAVDGLDLAVEPGEVFGFLGPNGAGKTTTIRCLVGLLTPTRGSVRVLGLDPRTQGAQLLPRVGYLPGELRLYEELTGAQHLALLGELQAAPTPRRDELCARLDLTAAALARPVRGYSRGMKQKIGLVAALQHDPHVAILDEPSEGLDPLVQESLFGVLDDLRERGRTVFLSSHVLSEVERACDRVAIIRRGRLATVAGVEALRGAQARRVRLRLAPDAAVPDLPAAWSPHVDGDVIRLLLPGDDVVPALQRLLTGPVVDVIVEEAGLEEAFLAFYAEEAT